MGVEPVDFAVDVGLEVLCFKVDGFAFPAGGVAIPCLSDAVHMVVNKSVDVQPVKA